jgi:hypothetical protein
MGAGVWSEDFAPVLDARGTGHEEGRPSFLKKRSKKLLSVSGSAGASHLDRRTRATNKSFLVLFFKKELLFSFC